LFSFSIEQLMNSMSINKHWLFDIYDLFVFVFWSKHRRNQYDEFCKIRRVTWSFSFVLLSKTRRRTKEKRSEYDENIWFIWCIIDRQQEQEKEEEKNTRCRWTISIQLTDSDRSCYFFKYVPVDYTVAMNLTHWFVLAKSYTVDYANRWISMKNDPCLFLITRSASVRTFTVKRTNQRKSFTWIITINHRINIRARCSTIHTSQGWRRTAIICVSCYWYCLYTGCIVNIECLMILFWMQ
jgi:hypothetical protein